MREVELSGILDDYDALGLWKQRRECVEQRRLAGPGPAADQDVVVVGERLVHEIHEIVA